MLISYNWLKEYVEKCPTPQKLGEQLSLHSVEVEGLRPVAAASAELETVEIGNVVVAELLNIKKHPNADKLNIGKFDVGEVKPRQIIFGGLAKLKVGDKLPVALAPTRIKAGKITKQKLRGEVSEGMCCLNSELGILNQLDKVHFFDDNIVSGTPVAIALAKKSKGAGKVEPLDTILEIDNKSITHRADLFCHAGVAREVAAVFGTKFLYPKFLKLQNKLPKLNVSVKNYNACPRYIAVEMEVQTGEAPEFMRKRLQTVGIKSINNVVDITNYVMLELGEPLHAFDAAQISGNKIIVRYAKKGEELFTLDHENKELDGDVLVIADENKPIAIAGVIGGQHSAVTAKTKKIILEAANFSPLITRASAKKVGLRTEAALRWEKGLAPELAEQGVRNAIELLQKYAGAKIVKYVDIYPQKQKVKSVKLSAKFLERLSGSSKLAVFVPKLLKSLECEVHVLPNKTGWLITPPWFRQDLKSEEDLVEEIVRLYGVSKIPEQQLTAILQPPQQDQELETIFATRRALVAANFTEVYNYSFYGERIVKKMCWDVVSGHVEILNPLSEDARYLRVNLMPPLLENIAKNQEINHNLRFFEVGHVYTPDREVRQLAVVITGERDLYRVLRGEIESLLEILHINWQTTVIKQTAECQFWNLYEVSQALCFSAGKDILGTLGLVDAKILKNFDIKTPVAFAVLSFEVFARHKQSDFKVKSVSPFPPIPLDMSIIVAEKTTWQEIAKVIKFLGQPLLQEVEVFDIYRGKEVGTTNKSISIHLIFQAVNRTLKMIEIEKWRDRCVEILHKKFNATLRGEKK